MAKTKGHRTPLKEFVAKAVEASKCFLCSIPERQEIEEAKQGGAETKHIVQWLIDDCGYEEKKVKAARNQMGHHFSVHMHRRKGKDDWEATL